MPERSIAPPFVKTTSFDLIKPDTLTLPNGVETFFIGGGSQDVLKIDFIFEAGRWFESKKAASHFTGQLLSKGTRNRNSFEIAEIFDRYGAHLEISPGLDFVSVSLYTLRKNLATVLSLLMEILTEPTFPDKELRQAQDLFIQNLRVSNEKTSFVASQVFRKNLFGANHPYGVIVDESDVEALNTNDLNLHLNNHFRKPKVFVSGKITTADRALMLKSFESYQSLPQEGDATYKTAPGPDKQHIEKKDSVQSSIRIGKRSLKRSDADYVPVLFVSHIFGGYFGSRLMKNIREEKGLTYGISASIHGLKRGSYLIVGADVNRENTDLAFDEIRKELKTLRTTLISEGELETSRNHFIGSLQAEITTPFAHAEKLKTINLYGLSEHHYQRMIEKVDSITPAEIAEISERYYHEDSFIQVAVG